jgi:hypothetical protein
MGKKVKKALNIATFGLAGAAEKLAFDPIKAALGVAGGSLAGSTTNDATGSVAAPDAAPTATDPDTLAARESQRRRQALAAGMSSNILTGAQGLSGTATTQLKSLLGS